MKSQTFLRVVLLISIAMSISCSSPDTEATSDDEPNIFAIRYGVGEEAGRLFLEENKTQEGVTTHASGLQTKIISSGPVNTESPSPNAYVRYKSTRTLVDGTELPNSALDKDGISETVVPLMMPGIREGLSMMRVGDRWMLYIPPELAYGSEASGILGPNETIIFDLTLLEVDEQKGEFMVSHLP